MSITLRHRTNLHHVTEDNIACHFLSADEDDDDDGDGDSGGEGDG